MQVQMELSDQIEQRTCGVTTGAAKTLSVLFVEVP